MKLVSNVGENRFATMCLSNVSETNLMERPTKFFVGHKNGAEIDIAEMSIKRRSAWPLRESKAVRRSLVDKPESMQEAHIVR